MSPSMMESQIRTIHASGGTEIFQGLDAGFQEIRRNLQKTPINYIFLLTDGRTYGDEDACLELADKAAEAGVSITGLGIGNDWNDILMDELATRTGGSSLYISRSSDIRTILEEQFHNLVMTHAEKVQLSLDNTPGVQLQSVYRLQPDTSELKTGADLHLGHITKSSPLTVLLEFIVPSITQSVTRFTIANGKLSMIIPAEPHTPQTFSLRFSRPIGDEPDTDMPPQPILRALSLITLFRMQDRARKDVEDGKVLEASQRLEFLASQLHSIGEQKLGETALMEAGRIQETNMLSAEGLKQIKYGTRALLLPKPTGGPP
jgi:Ca-activated chloride channel family protein